MKANLPYQNHASIFRFLIVVMGFVSQPGRADESPKRDDYQVSRSTKFDFEDTTIEGRMQAPNGFFLQGRTPQALSQMVKLRAHFQTELRNSKSGVQVLSH